MALLAIVEKQSHNCTMYSHLAQKHITLKYILRHFNNGRISIKLSLEFQSTCPYFDNLELDIFDAGSLHCHFITSVTIAVGIRTLSVY